MRKSENVQTMYANKINMTQAEFLEMVGDFLQDMASQTEEESPNETSLIYAYEDMARHFIFMANE